MDNTLELSEKEYQIIYVKAQGFDIAVQIATHQEQIHLHSVKLGELMPELQKILQAIETLGAIETPES